MDDDPIVSSDNNVFWNVRWDLGTTEPGASGSSLFDQNTQRIIGQLSKGDAACSGDVSNEGEEDFGKIHYSWDQVGANPTEQLKPWLDPINSGVLFIDGNSCTVPLEATFEPTDNSQLFFCEPSLLRFKDQSIGIPTSWSWTFTGAGVSPNTSNEKNPEVTINSSGTLTVTLEVSNAQGTAITSQTYPVSFQSCTEETYCATPDLTIPDNTLSGVSSSITVPMSSNLQDLNIEVDISHDYVADLIIRIEHEGTTASILSRPNQPIGDCFKADIIATFDDEATLPAQSMCNNTVPTIEGFVIPFSSLGVFDNRNLAGVWTLTIVDISGGDIGTLNSWCIKATTFEEQCFEQLTHANGLLQTEISVSNYESSDWISTSLPTVVESSARVVYNAAQFVEINPPFEVKSGATFEAIINGCSNEAATSAILERDTIISTSDNSVVGTSSMLLPVDNIFQKEQPSLKWLQVRPIPAQDWLSVAFITTEISPVTISIFDTNGRLILSKQLDDITNKENIVELGISNLEEGMYFLQLNNVNASIQYKFIKG